MTGKVDVRTLLTGLSILGALTATTVVAFFILAPRNDAPTFLETDSVDRSVLENGEESSSAETVHTTNTSRSEEESQNSPEASPPEIDDPPNGAELEDLQFIADRKGISLQEAIERYAWNDNFSLAVSRIREVAPATFAGAEIVDAAHAWIAFTGRPPKAALDIIELFRSSHKSVSVEVRTDLKFSEAVLGEAIPAVHYAVFEAPGVLDASTSFDYATGQIKTNVVLESTASNSVVGELQAIAEMRLVELMGPGILDTISISVARSESPVLGGHDNAPSNR